MQICNPFKFSIKQNLKDKGNHQKIFVIRFLARSNSFYCLNDELYHPIYEYFFSLIKAYNEAYVFFRMLIFVKIQSLLYILEHL